MQLLKLANNVNQIARHLNGMPDGAGEAVNVGPENMELTADMQGAVAAIREHVALAAGMLGKSRERWVLLGGTGREH